MAYNFKRRKKHYPMRYVDVFVRVKGLEENRLVVIEMIMDHRIRHIIFFFLFTSLGHGQWTWQ